MRRKHAEATQGRRPTEPKAGRGEAGAPSRQRQTGGHDAKDNSLKCERILRGHTASKYQQNVDELEGARTVNLAWRTPMPPCWPPTGLWGMRKPAVVVGERSNAASERLCVTHAASCARRAPNASSVCHQYAGSATCEWQREGGVTVRSRSLGMTAHIARVGGGGILWNDKELGGGARCRAAR